MAYTTGDVLVRAVMHAASGLPADDVINDWAFQFDHPPDSSELEDVCDNVGNFYTDPGANTHAVGEYISDQISRSATHELQAWIITAPPLGSPDFTKDWLGPIAFAAGAHGLPTECAGVLSFHADLTGVLEESGATRPRARRRGRVFIGPIGSTAIDPDTPPYYLSTLFRQTLAQAAVTLYDDAQTNGATWSVWSRADALLRPVVGGWTDNAPDIQRRRGPAASLRASFTTV